MENKNKLKHVSFAGIDRNTDREELSRIQDEFPMVEFGVLMSRNWFENGNRYIPSKTIKMLNSVNMINIFVELINKLRRNYKLKYNL